MLFALLLAAAPICAAMAAPSASTAGVEKVLRGLVRVWDARFNSRDTEGLLELYAEDAQSMPFDARTVKGRRDLRAQFETLFAMNIVRHETTPEEFLIGAGWAIERSRYTLVATPRSGGPTVTETGRHVNCWRLIAGEWLIVWEIWNTDGASSR